MSPAASLIEPTHGRPARIASRYTNPNPSRALGIAKTATRSHRALNAGAGRNPQKRTCEATPRARAFSWRPRPVIPQTHDSELSHGDLRHDLRPALQQAHHALCIAHWPAAGRRSTHKATRHARWGRWAGRRCRPRDAAPSPLADRSLLHLRRPRSSRPSGQAMTGPMSGWAFATRLAVYREFATRREAPRSVATRSGVRPGSQASTS